MNTKIIRLFIEDEELNIYEEVYVTVADFLELFMGGQACDSDSTLQEMLNSKFTGEKAVLLGDNDEELELDIKFDMLDENGTNEAYEDMQNMNDSDFVLALIMMLDMDDDSIYYDMHKNALAEAEKYDPLVTIKCKVKKSKEQMLLEYLDKINS